MIAPDDRDRIEAADAIDDAVRLAAVADQVAEHEQAVPLAVDRGQYRLERVEVGVDVGENEVGGMFATARDAPSG